MPAMNWRTVIFSSGDVAKWPKAAVCKTAIHRFESGRRLVFLVWIVLASGCTYIVVGHRFDVDDVERLVPGVTTAQQALETFGQPSTVTRKGADEVTVYTFKNLRMTSFGLPFPILHIGKAADRGDMLNIVVKHGVVMDYELVKQQGGY